MQHESGGHRWQRVPPTEKKGRVQTSTFTVSVFRESKTSEFQLNLAEVTFQATKGTGPGGQHRNKRETAIRAVHRPTGQMVFCQNNRSQHANKAEAIRLLGQKVQQVQQKSGQAANRIARQNQIGSGQRGDKVRTIQVQNGRVTNHVNQKKMTLKAYQKGEIWKLH